MDRRAMILGAAGASALLLTGCLGAAEGEDFVGYWVHERPVRQGEPARMLVAIKIERTGDAEFVATAVETTPFGGVRNTSFALRYMPENRLARDSGGRIFFLTIREGSLIFGDIPYRASTREEFDAFNASLAGQPRLP